MKNLEKLASLVLALTLTLGLCASTAGAAEELVKPMVFTKIKMTWTVTDTLKGVGIPRLGMSYINKWGEAKSVNYLLNIETDSYKTFFSQKGTHTHETTVRDIMELVYFNAVKITDMSVVAHNALPTFEAHDIKVEFFHYYAPTRELENKIMDSRDVSLLSQCVLFRTETYSNSGTFKIKSNQANKNVSLPNFRTTVVDHAPYPGGLPSNATGSVFGDGNTVVLWAGVAVLVIAVPTAILIRRKKNKTPAAG